MSQAIQQGAVV